MDVEKVETALVKAALDGVPQTRLTYRSINGFCALGVLLRECGYYENPLRWTGAIEALKDVYKFEKGDMSKVLHMNDTERMDFLTIARKLGNKEEAK